MSKEKYSKWETWQQVNVFMRSFWSYIFLIYFLRFESAFGDKLFVDVYMIST